MTAIVSRRVLGLLCVSLIAVAGAMGAREASARTIHLGARANGTTMTVAAGTTVIVTLDDCLTCGYRWVRPSGTSIRPSASSYVPANLPPGMVGGTGSAVFRFLVPKTGGTIRLVYLGPGRGATPSDRFRVTIRPR